MCANTVVKRSNCAICKDGWLNKHAKAKLVKQVSIQVGREASYSRWLTNPRHRQKLQSQLAPAWLSVDSRHWQMTFAPLSSWFEWWKTGALPWSSSMLLVVLWWWRWRYCTPKMTVCSGMSNCWNNGTSSLEAVRQLLTLSLIAAPVMLDAVQY